MCCSEAAPWEGGRISKGLLCGFERELNLRAQIYTLKVFPCLKSRESVNWKGQWQAWRLDSGHVGINQ